MYPERKLIDKMKPQPTEGEAYLLDFLEKILDDSWNVYFQASLDGAFPDIILVRPRHGALIIEVKDWDLSLYSEEDSEPYNWICHTADQGDQVVRSPLEQVKTYKNLFYEDYLRSLARAKIKDNSCYAVIDTAVFFYNASHREVMHFFSKSKADKRYMILLGYDDLTEERFQEYITKKDRFLFDADSRYFTDDICKELHEILRPSYHAIHKLDNIGWTKDQRRLYRSIAGKKQKIRGAAGCGKTMVLAHRAIDAYKKTHEPVLIITFNITLRHYIRDTINQLRNKDPKLANEKSFMGNFIIRHYHWLMKSITNAYDMPKIKRHKLIRGVNEEQETYIDFLNKHKGMFRTILVDEVQDYERGWIDQIRALAGDDTELVFFGDEEQNIYDRDLVTDGTSKHCCYTGIKGNWSQIHGSHRVEGYVADLSRLFQKYYFPDYDDNDVTPMNDLFAEPTSVYYRYVSKFDPEEIIEKAVDFMKEKGIHQDDICFLSNKVDSIRKIDKILRDSKYKTVTTFEREEEYRLLEPKLKGDDEDERFEARKSIESLRRIAKMRFWMETGKIKLSTVHSYKGWGIHTEILILDGRDDDISNGDEHLTPSIIYTGITRAKTNLIIFNICGKEYKPFFRKFFDEAKR